MYDEFLIQIDKYTTQIVLPHDPWMVKMTPNCPKSHLDNIEAMDNYDDMVIID